MTQLVIPHAADQWSRRVGNYEFRYWKDRHGLPRLYRKEHSSYEGQFFGGYQVKSVSVDSRIAQEWLAAVVGL